MAQKVVMSTDIDPVNVQVFGNWFSFKPGQIKQMDAKIVDFLCLDKKSYGFVSLPESCIEDKEAPESKELILNATKEGRGHIIAALNALIHNLEVSLKNDAERSKQGIPSSVTAAHLPYYRKLAKFKQLGAAEEAAALDEINKLKAQIDGDALSSNPSTSSNGS